MNFQFEALWEIHEVLSTRQIPYAVIGGMAVQRWGEPRFTRDVDITILVTPGREEDSASYLLEKFQPRISDALAFALKNRVLLLRASNGCEIDLSFGLPGYEEQVTARAVPFDLGGGRAVRLCSAEDLIIYKAVAGRPVDCSDIEGIILRQGKRLDIVYVKKWLTELAQLLDNPEVLSHFEKPWNQCFG